MSCTPSRKKLKRPRSATLTSRGKGLRRSNHGSANDHRPNPEDIRITPSSGNVFLDLGHSVEEARNLMLRSELMIQVTEIIERRKLKQHEAAKLFGVTQPRISNLVRGRIDLFSLDTLIAMVSRAGMAVHLIVKQSAA